MKSFFTSFILLLFLSFGIAQSVTIKVVHSTSGKAINEVLVEHKESADIKMTNDVGINGLWFLRLIGLVRSRWHGGTVDAHEESDESDGVNGEGVCWAKVREHIKVSPYHVDGMLSFYRLIEVRL